MVYNIKIIGGKNALLWAALPFLRKFIVFRNVYSRNSTDENTYVSGLPT